MPEKHPLVPPRITEKRLKLHLEKSKGKEVSWRTLDEEELR